MINWLFGESKPLFQESKATAKPKIIPMVRRILSIDKAKRSDELITIGTVPEEDLGPYIIEQYIRRGFGNWFHYPGLDKAEFFSPYEKMYESYQIRKDYADEPVLAMAIKARKSAVKCIYCHSEIEHKAQVCLDCGGFLCLECAPTQEKCPTLGCKQ